MGLAFAKSPAPAGLFGTLPRLTRSKRGEAVAVVENPQTSFEEKLVDDPQLLELLRKRRRLNEAKAEAAKAAKEAHEAVLAKLGEHDLEAGQTIRVGDYLVTKRHVGAAEVAFTRGGRDQLTIRFAGAE